MQRKFFLTLLFAVAIFIPTFAKAELPALPQGCCAFKSNLRTPNHPYYYCFNRENRHPVNDNISFMDSDCTSTNFTEKTKLQNYVKNTYVAEDQKNNWITIIKNNDPSTVTFLSNAYCDNNMAGATAEEVCVSKNTGSDKFRNNFISYCSARQCEKEPNKETAITPSTTPKIKLVQLGLKTSETGYFMDNCIKDGNCSVCAVIATIAYVISWLFKIGVLGAFLMVTRYGFMLLTSAGKPEKVKEARAGITGTLIGLVLLFSGWTIVNSVFSTFIAQDPSADVSIFSDGRKWYQFCEADAKPKK